MSYQNQLEKAIHRAILQIQKDVVNEGYEPLSYGDCEFMFHLLCEVEDKEAWTLCERCEEIIERAFSILDINLPSERINELAWIFLDDAEDELKTNSYDIDPVHFVRRMCKLSDVEEILE